MERRPLFKKIIFVRVLEDGALRMAETFPCRAVEVEDEDGSIQRLIQLMDGTRTVSELLAELQREYPELTVEDLEGCLLELDQLGFLDDAALRDRSGLTDVQQDRWKANLNFFSYHSKLTNSPWDMQQRLSEARVTIIGLGTLGSGVLFAAAGAGVKQVRVVDFDRVELSNLNRQMLYNEQDLGRLKVEAAADFMKRFYADMVLEQRVEEIRSIHDAERAIQGSDVVVLAADQPHFQLERWVNAACVRHGIPFLGGGVNVMEAQCYMVLPGQTGCIDCNHLRQHIQTESYAEFIRAHRASGFRMPSAATAANYMLLTGLVGGELIRLMTGSEAPRSAGKVLTTSFSTYTTRETMDFTERMDDCPTCGTGREEDIPLFQYMVR
jgi:molybdopterin-synthase adenylyltransferase